MQKVVIGLDVFAIKRKSQAIGNTENPLDLFTSELSCPTLDTTNPGGIGHAGRGPRQLGNFSRRWNVPSLEDALDRSDWIEREFFVSDDLPWTWEGRQKRHQVVQGPRGREHFLFRLHLFNDAAKGWKFIQKRRSLGPGRLRPCRRAK